MSSTWSSAPSPTRGPARCGSRSPVAGSAGRTCTPATGSTSGPTWPRSWATTASAAPTSRSSSGTSSAAGSPSTGPVPAGRAERRPGRRASAPAQRRQGVDTTGLSQHAPGAYAEQLLVQESMMMPVPNGLDPAVAALTEPMAVALHAVRRGEVAQAGRGDRDRLRPGRPRGDPDAEGDRRAHRRRQRLLGRPAGARRALRSRRRRRPLARTPPTSRASDPGWLSNVPDAFELAARHARETRPPAGRLVARLAPGGEARRRPEAPGDLRVRRRPGRDRRDRRLRPALLPGRRRRRLRRARHLHARRWRSTRRSTCASSSATPRSSSATPSTCSPTARSTRGR